jgi:hypothetical protein
MDLLLLSLEMEGFTKNFYLSTTPYIKYYII